MADGTAGFVIREVSNQGPLLINLDSLKLTGIVFSSPLGVGARRSTL